MANGNGRHYKTNGRSFFGMSRSEKRANNNLGVILGNNGFGLKGKHHRSDVLKSVDQYLNGSQYAGKVDWDDTYCNDADSYVKMKDRKPKIIFPFAKIFQDRMSSKLVGASTFPKFKIEEDEEAEFFINNVLIPNSYFKAKMLGLSKDLILRTSAFMRYRFVDGNLQMVKYNSNHCYPVFGEDGLLESVEVKYIYTTDEVDPQTGKMIKRWFRLVLDRNADTLYDNPIFHDDVEPEFQVEDFAVHEMGFVQGEWFRIGENQNSPDGEEDPIIYMMRDFIDCLNYNLSQSDKAVNYATEPQLAIKGLDSEDAEELIKSASKTWLLGRDGEAQFLQAGSEGANAAKQQRDDYLKLFQHIARIVLLDPEKMAANAQSGKAMEIMHAPMVELVNELRPWTEKGMVSLLEKISTSIVLLGLKGFETQFTIPKRWMPSNLKAKAIWPPIFELTTQDQQQILSIGLQAANGNIISRDTALRWIQAQGVDFGVEDFEAEMQKVNSQQQFNTFGF